MRWIVLAATPNAEVISRNLSRSTDQANYLSLVISMVAFVLDNSLGTGKNSPAWVIAGI